MKRTACGLIGLGLAAGLAGGQPPSLPRPRPQAGDPPAATPTPIPDPAAQKKSPLDEAIATAMRSNPDVRVAEAEVQVAQAKLAQARLLAAQKVAAAHAGLEKAKADQAAAEETFARVTDLLKKGMVPQGGVVGARQQLEAAKANAARAKADYDAATGTMPGQQRLALNLTYSPDGKYAANAAGELFAFADSGPVKVVFDASPSVAPGSFPDRLRAALAKPVKLPEQKDVDVGAALTAVMKAAGVEGRVRVPARIDPRVFRNALPLTLPAGEYPLGTWFQLIADECAIVAAGATPNDPIPLAPRYEFYVREYGLLVADPKNPPPGAATVAELGKLSRVEKEKPAGNPAKP